MTSPNITTGRKGWMLTIAVAAGILLAIVVLALVRFLGDILSLLFR